MCVRANLQNVILTFYCPGQYIPYVKAGIDIESLNILNPRLVIVKLKMKNKKLILLISGARWSISLTSKKSIAGTKSISL